MELKFRKATAEDTESCIDLVYSAAPELQEYIFTRCRKSAKNYLAHEFRNGGGFFGHRNHTVAILNNKVVAVAAFCSRDSFAPIEKEAFSNMLSFYGVLGIIPVIYRARHAPNVIPKQGTIYIANVGVRPDMRSHGIGSALIRYGTKQAKSKGFTEMSLDVASNNPRAEALYRRLGFSFVDEKSFSKKNANIPNSKFYVMPI